ncbi:MAG: assembly factor cbp4 [Phylliscum demangeonii]|nr:MAG: assembly factor cbp4 [Phylliscum demangeonii]
MTRAGMWLKMGITAVVLCVGGPALVVWLSPTEEELFKRFNPELQKRNLERREERLEQYQDFLYKLKEYSKSDKPIWVVAAEAEAKAKAETQQEQLRVMGEAQKLKEEIRRHSTGRN